MTCAHRPRFDGDATPLAGRLHDKECQRHLVAITCSKEQLRHWHVVSITKEHRLHRHLHRFILLPQDGADRRQRLPGFIFEFTATLRRHHDGESLHFTDLDHGVVLDPHQAWRHVRCGGRTCGRVAVLTALHRALRIQQSPVRRKVVADRGFRGGGCFDGHGDNLLAFENDWINSLTPH